MKQLLQKAANSVGYRISKIRPPIDLPYIDVLDLVLQNYRQQNPDPFFIQIGAHDGQSSDPMARLIRQYHLRGLLIEPQPKTFKQLVANYQDQPQLTFENAAICPQDGIVTFYAIREDEPLPTWCHQIANLDRDRVLAMLADQKENLNLPDDVERFVEPIEVRGVTLGTLLQEHHIDRLDLLMIDALGLDFEIIKMIPFDQVQPAIIHFEHALMSLDEQADCLTYLKEQGYAFAQVAVDTIAYRAGEVKPR